jgi:hypothetical protein
MAAFMNEGLPAITKNRRVIKHATENRTTAKLRE